MTIRLYNVPISFQNFELKIYFSVNLEKWW